MNKYDPKLQHALFKKLQTIVAKDFKKTGAKVQAHTLHLETIVKGGVNDFSVLTNDSNVPLRSSEIRLQQNDAFIATHIKLGIKAEASSKPGSALIQTYPNAQIFALEAGYVTLADLNAIFNSKLTYSVGDSEKAKSLDMSKSLFVPQSQQAAATTFSQIDTLDGFFASEPIMSFDGADSISLKLNVPSWVGQQIQYSTAGNGNTIYAVLKLDGFLIRNGSGYAAAAAKALGKVSVNGIEWAELL